MSLQVSKPVSVWNREVQIDPKPFFINICKMIKSGLSMDFGGLADNALDTIENLGLKPKPEQLAWLLIHRSMLRAIHAIVENTIGVFDRIPEEDRFQGICEGLEQQMAAIEITIDHDFFKRPDRSDFIDKFKAPVTNWFTNLGINETEAQNLFNRLPERFLFALNEEWRTNASDYAPIKEHFDTPFEQRVGEKKSWNQYYRFLKLQIEDSMFGETFGVDKVYIPPRAYWEERADSDREVSFRLKNVKYVIDLETELKQWLQNFTPKDAVKFVSGGPGSGKSTVAKIFATWAALEASIPTIYIPLHLLDITDNLITAVERFAQQNRYLDGSPLDAAHGEERLFIIFDGLDELALLGKAASEAANEFVDEVIRRIKDFNYQGLKRQVLITGRDLAIQSVAAKLREKNQILYLLPYYINQSEHEDYVDPTGLLTEDQRHKWWRLYGKATGKNYDAIPDNLRIERLEEITAQPLLNYLVALSYDRNKINFTSETSLNEIYADLLEGVYYRQYESGRLHRGVCDLPLEIFIRILEEIAIAIWHGDGRTTTINSIKEKCEKSGLGRYLPGFQEGAEKGVSRLLTAFYFRQSAARISDEKTFEFTHKSFGEYLTARRIVRLVERIDKQMGQHALDPEDGWDPEMALQRWTEICGPTKMDDYLFEYLKNQVRLNNNDSRLKRWQTNIAKLLSIVINQGMPMEKFRDFKFQQQLKHSRNAEESLMATHFAIAGATRVVSPIRCNTPTNFGSWLARVRGQRSGLGKILVSSSLGFLYLKDPTCLVLTDLFKVNFEGTNLQGAKLQGAKLQGAKLQEANLHGADLQGANLGRANLQGAKLQGANLQGANLQGANLGRANLQGADLQGADLQGAYLQGAYLQWANLQGADLKGADLQGADLKGADLFGAKLQEANLKEANLKEANLKGAKLQGAKLQGANLKEADLPGAYLEGANLKGAKLQEANLKGAYLQEAYLQGADLQGANLEKTIYEKRSLLSKIKKLV